MLKGRIPSMFNLSLAAFTFLKQRFRANVRANSEPT